MTLYVVFVNKPYGVLSRYAILATCLICDTRKVNKNMFSLLLNIIHHNAFNVIKLSSRVRETRE